MRVSRLLLPVLNVLRSIGIMGWDISQLPTTTDPAAKAAATGWNA